MPAGPDRWAEFQQGLTLGRMRFVASALQGETEQMPPPFSAKKIEGTPAYKLARAGKPVELKRAKVKISSFAISRLEERRG